MVLLAACSDEKEEVKGQRVTFEVRSSIPTYVEAQRKGGETRAWTPPTGYKTYDELNGEFEGQRSMENLSIETFFTKDGDTPQQGTFFYNEHSNSWKLSMIIQQSGTYFLYGFLPKNEAASSSIAANSSFSNGAVLTLNGLNTVTPSDICVIVGAKEGTNADTDNGIRTGDFSVGVRATSNENHNYVFLLFDHLYSAMRLRFVVDDEYNALRTIKLRKLELKPLANDNGTTVKAKYTSVVTLQANDAGESPIVGNITFTPENNSADAELEPLYEGEVTLSTSPINFMGSFIPGCTNHFKVRTTYDVYDKAGNLIREGETAENTINLSNIFEISTIQRGHMYSITLKVQPTYLNVLSGPDLSMPTVVVE